MYELACRGGITAAELAEDLELDRGYLSRLLKGFEEKKLLARTASPQDGRRQHLRLTPAGRRVFDPLDRRSQEQVRAMLVELDEERRRAVLQAMDVIQDAFGGTGPAADAEAGVTGEAGTELPMEAASSGTIEATKSKSSRKMKISGKDANSKLRPRAELLLRGHHPGDMGWVVQRHGEIYHQEYGWNEEFEALVAQIAAEFVQKLDPARERCWIAERGGRRVGCIFLVAKDLTTAKLRLLLVDPAARGLGVGRRLVSECVRFAREVGYQRMVLWTQQNLTAARHLYREAGFQCTAEEPHRSFGCDLIAETWELEFRPRPAQTRP
jgi:DNA-binding MarR family transcriptional regulator/GNAT superfamily N-acetyltransferase